MKLYGAHPAGFVAVATGPAIRTKAAVAAPFDRTAVIAEGYTATSWAAVAAVTGPSIVV